MASLSVSEWSYGKDSGTAAAFLASLLFLRMEDTQFDELPQGIVTAYSTNAIYALKYLKLTRSRKVKCTSKA